MNQEKVKIDLYSLVTNQIISQLEQKIVPWQKPWTNASIPQNLITRNPYRGINLLLLASLGYSQSYFVTWKQLKLLGGSVKKGEKGQIIVFWKPIEAKELPQEGVDVKVSKSVLQYYKVFNIEQCSSIPQHFIPKPTIEFSSIDACEKIVNGMANRPVIEHKRQEAFYNPTKDYINMPKPETFKNSERYYSVLFHELIHSTGHESRLNRKELIARTNFGAKDYSIEELTAEIGACFLNSITNIGNSHFKQSVSYIKGWLDALKNDKRLIFYASTQAQKAVDYMAKSSPIETN